MYKSIGELQYQGRKGTWTPCNNCKNWPIDLYNGGDLNTGKPEALQELASHYKRDQIALPDIVSKIVKPLSDKFKIWKLITTMACMCSWSQIPMN